MGVNEYSSTQYSSYTYDKAKTLACFISGRQAAVPSVYLSGSRLKRTGQTKLIQRRRRRRRRRLATFIAEHTERRTTIELAMPASRARRPRNDRPNVFRAINMLDAPRDAPNTDAEKIPRCRKWRYYTAVSINWSDSRRLQFYVSTRGKLFTLTCLCYQAV